MKRFNRFHPAAAIALAFLLLLAACSGAAGSPTPEPLPDPTPEPTPTPLYSIMSPYDGVDWESFGQYKAALHVHTGNSDGAHSMEEMIEDHYEKDFDILAITDHNVLTEDWVSVRNGITQERFDEIAAGAGRGGRGMLQIPYTNEQSRPDHLNTFFTDFNNSSGASLRENIEKTQELGGLSHINHPGRYTGGQRGGEFGEERSNTPEIIQKYVDLFMEFPTCVGMEIINKLDNESRSDRILWDNILTRTMPENRPVWGFSNDDSHSKSNVGHSFNLFIMPENTLEQFRSAMESGRFLAVSRVGRREFERVYEEGFFSQGDLPGVTSIKTNEADASITIAAEDYDHIEWIADGEVVAGGNTINLKEHQDEIGSYVRANIIGPGGIIFTQPFGLRKNE